MAKQKKPKRPVQLTDFNRRIIELLETEKYTQEELATKVGCTQQGIGKLKNKRQNGSIYTAQIAEAYGVSPMWLAKGEEPKYRPNDLSSDAMAIGFAWSLWKGSYLKTRLTHDLLRTALSFLPPEHSLYRVAEKLYQETSKKLKVNNELETAN
jgi:transcriptional regulator with XRE-family HTH domain